jgi:cytochrome oxidase Cu insertion factor (SCO1/SenC/PrrC family)
MNRLLRIAIAAVLVAGLHAANVDPVQGDAKSNGDLWSAADVSRLPSGTPAPPVVLNDLDGKKVDLRDLRGRLVMLYFWATW